MIFIYIHKTKYNCIIVNKFSSERKLVNNNSQQSVSTLIN